MATRIELQYELAQIELDKRQLQLERRELDAKHRLALLNIVDLTEEEALVKAEPQYSSDTHSSAGQTASAEPLGDENMYAVTSSNDKVAEQETDAAKAISAEPPDTATTTVPTQADSTQQDPLPPPRPGPVSPNTPTGNKDLLAKFLGRPDKAVARSEHAGSKRPLPNIADEIDTLSKQDDKSGNENKPNPANGNGSSKRRRTSRAENKLEKQEFGMTESDHYELISRYTDNFLRHMQAVERKLDPQAGKHAITARVRQAKVGKAHPSIASLHEEFSLIMAAHAKNSVIHFGLQAELEKFESALPYWSPRCKISPTQEVRLAMVNRVVEKIAKGEFDAKKYEEYYDPYDEL